jgi:hypothetical protein
MNTGESGLKERPMREHSSETEGLSISQPSLEERPKEYPELKAKIEAMLGFIENAGGDVEKAAEAEQRIFKEMPNSLNCPAPPANPDDY